MAPGLQFRSELYPENIDALPFHQVESLHLSTLGPDAWTRDRDRDGGGESALHHQCPASCDRAFRSAWRDANRRRCVASVSCTIATGAPIPPIVVNHFLQMKV
jgi:hypothetical protein